MKYQWRKLEDDTNKRRLSCALGLEELISYVHTTQSNLQVQRNISQNSHDIFHRTIKNNSKIHMETTKDCQNNLEKKKAKLMVSPFLTSDHSTKLHNQNIVVLTQNRRMDQQNLIEHGSKPMHLQSINLWQRRQEYAVKKTISSTNGAGKTGWLHIKMKLKHFLKPYKYKLEMD